MPTSVKLLAARRAYEFGPDDIRLTLLATQAAQALLRERFGFSVAAVGTPMPTFGTVTATLPPGVVFDTGSFTTEAGEIIPIRFLHFEATRVVIDLAGATESIDQVYSELRRTLNAFKAGDGAEVLGVPVRVLDLSELTWRPAFDPGALLKAELLNLFHEFGNPSPGLVPLPSIGAQWGSDTEPYQGAITTAGQFTLQVRAGSRPVDRILFSSAPLSTARHVAYIERLEDILTRPEPAVSH